MLFMNLFFSVSVYQYILVKPVSRSVMRVGSYTAWNMAFNLTDKCHRTRRSAEETIVSTHFSARPELGNTFQELCLLIWSQLLSVNNYFFTYCIRCAQYCH